MSESPLISVIVPVYKVEAYLDRCVQSIVDQTYTNLEIILVDDGSPDRCPQMCDEWAKKDKRIRVIHKENGGLSDARNAGLAIASGAYISFIDSDDWIEPRFEQRLLEAILDHQCDVAACKYRRCTEKTKNEDIPSFSVLTYGRYDAMRELIDGQAVKVVVWNKLYKRNVIEGILFEKGKYHEDEFWTYQIIGKLERYALIDYIGYNYFQRTDSIMGEGYSIKRLDAIEAKVCRQEYLEANMPELAGQGARVNLAFACMWHGQLAMRDMNKLEKRQAFSMLNRMYRKYPVQSKDMKQLKASHRIWIRAANISLPLTCWARNMLKVGV